MAATRVESRSGIGVGVGVVAGIIGGVLIDAFLSIANQTNLISIWQFIASALVGGAAFSSPAYAALGFAMHFAISIAWGTGYALLAATALPWLARRPVLGGIVYGVVVMLTMTVLLVIAHVAPPGPPSAVMLVKSLIAHTAFFGVPVGLYVASAFRRS